MTETENSNVAQSSDSEVQTSTIATAEKSGALPSSVTDAVLKPSQEMPAGSQKVEELDFNAFAGRQITVEDLISGMANMGFQASSIGEAVRIINDMVGPHLIFRA